MNEMTVETAKDLSAVYERVNFDGEPSSDAILIATAVEKIITRLLTTKIKPEFKLTWKTSRNKKHVSCWCGKHQMARVNLCDTKLGYMWKSGLAVYDESLEVYDKDLEKVKERVAEYVLDYLAMFAFEKGR